MAGPLTSGVPGRTGAPGPLTMDLAVTGMHCGSCAALIEETLTRQTGIEGASVDLGAARARVTFDPSATGVDDVCALVAGLGYAATPIGDDTPGV